MFHGRVKKNETVKIFLLPLYIVIFLYYIIFTLQNITFLATYCTPFLSSVLLFKKTTTAVITKTGS